MDRNFEAKNVELLPLLWRSIAHRSWQIPFIAVFFPKAEGPSLADAFLQTVPHRQDAS